MTGWWAVAALGAERDARDVERMFDTIEARYAYLDPQRTDLQGCRDRWIPAARAATTHAERVGVFEQVLEALVDSHATLGTNLPSSTRLVPSALDTWGELAGPGLVVSAVRPGWPADRAGVRPGDVIVAVNGTPAPERVQARIGPCVRADDPEVQRWAALVVLAGTHDTPRVWTLADGRTLTLDDPDEMPAREPVTVTTTPDGFVVVALHQLGDSATIRAFDAALEQARAAPGLVIDLRDTAAGGSTTVAEPVLGRFVSERTAYQRIVPTRGEAWDRRVSPRGPWTWDGPVVVVADRWTGSMGEGMALGFDAIGVPVVGTPMAGLKGAVHTFRTRSGVSWNLPTDRLQHVDGTPRERWVPPALVPVDGTGDPVLERAVERLRQGR